MGTAIKNVFSSYSQWVEFQATVSASDDTENDTKTLNSFTFILTVIGVKQLHNVKKHGVYSKLQTSSSKQKNNLTT